METKEQILKAFSQALDKQCPEPQDLHNVINAIFDQVLFIDAQSNHDHDLIFDILDAKTLLPDLISNEYASTLEECGDVFIKSMILAGRFEKANERLFEALNDSELLNALKDE